MKTSIKTGDKVWVNEQAYGVVKYVTTDGIGVQLLNETRVDEWHPCQVRKAVTDT